MQRGKDAMLGVLDPETLDRQEKEALADAEEANRDTRTALLQIAGGLLGGSG